MSLEVTGTIEVVFNDENIARIMQERESIMIRNLGSNCVLRALQLVSDHPDRTVIAACMSTDERWQPGQGLYDHHWIKAAELLDIQLEDVKVPGGHTWQTRRNWWGEETDVLRFKGDTLLDFCKSHPEGVFLVNVHGHLLVVKDGCSLDVNVPGRMGRQVRAARRVLNPRMKAGLGTYFFAGKLGRHGTAAWRRRWEAMQIMNAAERGKLDCPDGTTLEWIEQNTPMTAADIKWDVRRGKLREHGL